MNGTHVLAFTIGICFLLSAQIFAALLLNKRKPTPVAHVTIPKDVRYRTVTLCKHEKIVPAPDGDGYMCARCYYPQPNPHSGRLE